MPRRFATLPRKAAPGKSPAGPPATPAQTAGRRHRLRLALAAAACALALAFAALSTVASLSPGGWTGAPAPAPTGAAAVRARAWQRTQPLLDEADSQAAAALDRHLASIHAFLAARKPGARAFARQMLGLRGKWEFVKAQVAGGGQEQYALYLDQAFAEHVFAADDLEQAVAAAVKGYLAELDGVEERLLVKLRADLADDQLPGQAVLPALGSDQAFQDHYRELSRRLAGDLATDLAVVAGREAVLWESIPLATDLTLKAGAAVAARLGISGTILSAGAASSWRTLGVGLVVAIVLDAVINRIIQAAGYDAEQQIAERVGQTLDDLGTTITDGSPEARATLEQLQALERDDPDPDVRAASAKAVRSIEAGTQLYGLRRELTNIAAARAALRKETLRRFIQDKENP
jgi:hypothetical protein